MPENVDLALVLASAADAARPAKTPSYLKEGVGKAGFGPAVLRSPMIAPTPEQAQTFVSLLDAAGL